MVIAGSCGLNIISWRVDFQDFKSLKPKKIKYSLYGNWLEVREEPQDWSSKSIRFLEGAFFILICY